MKKYKGRADVLHLKDFVCKAFGGGPVYALIDNEGKENDAPPRRITDLSSARWVRDCRILSRL